jgi:hypothetical protein
MSLASSFVRVSEFMRFSFQDQWLRAALGA